MKHEEDDMTIAFASYLRMHKNKPLFAHVPNGGARSKREGARFKAMGVLKGCPDMLIFGGGHSPLSYCGLAIELKTKSGKVSDDQHACLKAFEDKGWKSCICRSLEQAIKEFEDFIE
jgi:hypothetical protein